MRSVAPFASARRNRKDLNCLLANERRMRANSAAACFVSFRARTIVSKYLACIRIGIRIGMVRLGALELAV